MERAMSDSDIQRYMAASHAMQTGVRMDHERGSNDGTPKHLRVGVNSSMVNNVAIATLLIEKGIITEDEYEKALADAMEEEVARYKRELGLPPNVDLA
jgi:hypothetical protein